MQTPDDFISLASQLRSDERTPLPESAPPEPEFDDDAAQAYALDEAAVVRDVRLFRARIAEALEETVRALLCDIAADVLARELQSAPADIAAIVRAALERCTQEQPLRIRAHPDDAGCIACHIPVVEDPRLSPGDVVVELRRGLLRSTLGLRLDAVLANVAP